MMTAERRLPWLSLLCAGALAVAACKDSGSAPGPNAGGHTNWLRCVKLADCAGAATAVRCSEDGYCLDAAARRIAVGAQQGQSGTRSTGTSGGGGRDGGGGQSGSAGGDVELGGTSAAGSGGTSADAGESGQGSSDGGSSGSRAADAGPSAGTGGAGDAATQQCSGLPAGCGVEGAVCCDPYPCDGPNFCKGGLRCCPGGCRADCDAPLPPPRIPECPGTFERCDSGRCIDGQTCTRCGPGQVCVEVELSCGPAGGATANCVADPCAGNALDCSCAREVCDMLPAEQGGWACGVYARDHALVGPTRVPFMSCTGGGICASPDTPIATPRGEVPIAELRAGDLVYSLDRGQLVAVPLLATARTAVRDHSVVRAVLEDGAALEISGPHPTADGRRFDALAPGDALDGRRIVAIEHVPYLHAFTHDVLPASDSGTYLASGVWLGSTLAR